MHLNLNVITHNGANKLFNFRNKTRPDLSLRSQYHFDVGSSFNTGPTNQNQFNSSLCSDLLFNSSENRLAYRKSNRASLPLNQVRR